MSLEIMLALPFIVVTAGAIVLMLLSSKDDLSIKNHGFIAVAFLALAFLLELSFLNNIETIYLFSDIFGRMFVVDTFSVLFDLMFLGGAILTILINTRYFKSRDYYNGEFFSLLLFSVLGMMLLAHSNELITAFIALEIASIAVYILVGYNKNNSKSAEAMLKYIVLGALTGAFFILGSALIYGAVESTYIGDIYAYINTHPYEDMTMIIVGLVFILITILFKIGAVPFHTWVVDVYQGAPFPVTMFMAATFKIALFAILLRLFLLDFIPIYETIVPILQVITIVTLIGGSMLAISQNNLKRMLAGSSVVHGGYLLIAVSSVGLGADFAAPAIIFYLVAYFISGVGAFGILSFVASDKKTRLTYDDFKGFGHERPYLAAMMTIFMLSLAGFPSTMGFLGKFYIFLSAVESGQILIAGLGIAVAFVSIYYYFKLIAVMYFYPATSAKRKFPFNTSTVFIALMAVMTIWGGIGTGLIPFLPDPDSIINIAHESIFGLANR